MLTKVITAGFGGMLSCGHQINKGDTIGKVNGQWVCHQCYAPHYRPIAIEQSQRKQHIRAINRS